MLNRIFLARGGAEGIREAARGKKGPGRRLVTHGGENVLFNPEGGKRGGGRA